MGLSTTDSKQDADSLCTFLCQSYIIKHILKCHQNTVNKRFFSLFNEEKQINGDTVVGGSKNVPVCVFRGNLQFYEHIVIMHLFGLMNHCFLKPLGGCHIGGLWGKVNKI